MIKRCAECNCRIKSTGAKTECRPCRELTKKILNRVSCQRYYQRRSNQGFCTPADVRMLFYSVALVPAKSTYGKANEIRD